MGVRGHGLEVREAIRVDDGVPVGVVEGVAVRARATLLPVVVEPDVAIPEVLRRRMSKTVWKDSHSQRFSREAAAT